MEKSGIWTKTDTVISLEIDTKKERDKGVKRDKERKRQRCEKGQRKKETKA